MNKAMPDFKTRIMKALGDKQLRGAVRYTADNLRTKRNAAITDLNAQAAENLSIGTFDDLRQQARAIKEHTIKHLDYYLEKAAENIRANGGTVHWAANAADVIRITEEIIDRRNAKKVIKAKSMASEEVFLNHALEAKGVEVVESDLGEYIIQLVHETPAHIVIPAIHKTRQQIADMFGKVAGRELTTDTPTLTKFARETLRKKFMAADVGVSGSNFVVAETGTLCMVTNEGNGRLSTSVPPVHLAIVGMEKLVPTFEDLGVLYGLLPRSATGQKISTYFNMITGPRREGEPDGPEELHVIFLDNGRTNILGTEYEETLYCIRCGACLNFCPVYRNIGGHAYGAIYPGPIGAVISPLLNDMQQWTDLPQASSLCGACHEACPLGIHLHEHLISLREKMVEQGKADPSFAKAMKLWMAAWRRPWLYRLLAKIGYLGMRSYTQKRADGTEVATSLPGPFKAWTDTRTFPPVVKRPFHQRWAELEKEGAK